MARHCEIEMLFKWSQWQRLDGCWMRDQVPSLPGLYRIRVGCEDQLVYIGQTGTGGMSLKKRMGMLRGIYKGEMPYRAPHTAGPALWALRHKSRCDFEVSVCPVEGSTAWRKGLEAVAIALYRQQYGRSPSFNFGRMPEGYFMSSDNNRLLHSSGRVFRGGLSPASNASHAPSLQPAGRLLEDVQEDNWCGHKWSRWSPLTARMSDIERSNTGLYRIRQKGKSELLYVGQGFVRQRLETHMRKTLETRDRQGQIFAAAGPLECSWLINDTWLTHQRLELENDLIAAHILASGEVPAAQFFGGSGRLTHHQEAVNKEF